MSTLEQLQAHYSKLEAGTRRLTFDEQISLAFYRAEVLRESVEFDHDDKSRVTSWLRTVWRVEAFVAQAGRLPRRNSRISKEQVDPVEHALADWLRYQRRPRSQDLHCAYQRQRLELIAGFQWDPIEERWVAQLEALRTFRAENGRAPRYRSADQAEKSLAAWVGRQRKAMRAGTLDGYRAETFLRIAGGSTSDCSV
jgi:hypothetical protein